MYDIDNKCLSDMSFYISKFWKKMAWTSQLSILCSYYAPALRIIYVKKSVKYSGVH